MASINNTPRPAYVYDTATNEWIPIGVGAHSHNEIPKTVVDAKGDLIVGTAADEVNRLAVGSNGYILSAASGEATGLKYLPAQTFHGCSVYGSGSTQSIPNNTYTAVTFDSEIYDTDGYHSTSSNTSRITIPSGLAGYYLIESTNLTWDTNGSGQRQLQIYKNGSTLSYSNSLAGSASIYVSNSISFVAYLNVGDYIELYVSQSSGGNLNCYKRTLDNPLTVNLIGV